MIPGELPPFLLLWRRVSGWESDGGGRKREEVTGIEKRESKRTSDRRKKE